MIQRVISYMNKVELAENMGAWNRWRGILMGKEEAAILLSTSAVRVPRAGNPRQRMMN